MSRDPYRWDERVEAWEEVATSAAFLAIRDRIVVLAEPRRDDYVVDLGAGYGTARARYRAARGGGGRNEATRADEPPCSTG